MTGSAATIPPIHVLRSILRLLKTTQASNGGGARGTTLRPTQAYVMDQYRANQFIPDGHRIRELRQMAYNYSVLKRDLAQRKYLHELDTGAEVKLSPKEMTRRAAARAGLQVPKLDNPDVQE